MEKYRSYCYNDDRDKLQGRLEYMKIHEIIRERRLAKNYTQEQILRLFAIGLIKILLTFTGLR